MPTAKGKAAQPAQQDDMQEGDELEIITTACEWMYEFCARNDMTHAMTGAPCPLPQLQTTIKAAKCEERARGSP